jgi:heme/copper-type cytochrome/quinol oxidase subunit 2
MKKIDDFIWVLFRIAYLTFKCFISVTFCFVGCIYCFDHENDYLIKKEWIHRNNSNFILFFDRIRPLIFLSMFNTSTQNSLDNSSANKACPSSIHFLLSTIETIVCVGFIIFDSKWSEKGTQMTYISFRMQSHWYWCCPNYQLKFFR